MFNVKSLIKPGCIMVLASAGTVANAKIDGERDLLCESSDVVACVDGQCMQGPPGSFDLPYYMLVDVSDKVILGIDRDGDEATSPILHIDLTDDSVILQGIENHRGWSIGINRNDGDMSLGSTGAGVNFIISGNCSER